MKLRALLKKPTPFLAAAMSLAAGFLSVFLSCAGRAPFSFALLSLLRSQNHLLAALSGVCLGAMLAMDFTASLRQCAIAVLIYSVFAAFRDTRYIDHPLFPSAAVSLMCAAVEFAYLLKDGLSPSSLAAYVTYLLLLFSLCHHLQLLRGLWEKRGQSSADESLRRRLALSAAAFRDLYGSFGKAAPPSTEENPSVIFDRAAEAVCRSCKQSALCWNQTYVDTFNALNDATPPMLRRGKSREEDYPEHFRQRCLHFPAFLAAVNKELSELLLRRQYRRRLAAERKRAQGQYAQLAEFLGQAAGSAEVVSAAVCADSCAVGGAWRPKEGESVCGDVISHFETEDGSVCLLLSDGMGSGESANREAANLSRLLEQFLRAGVEPESALKTVNAALNLRGEDTGSFATADLLLCRAATGQITLYKYGAAPTYIKRHGAVRRLTGSALPVGLQDVRTVPAPIRFTAEAETFILLVSDGVVDPSDDDWLQNLLAGYQGSEPRRLVSLVMGESRRKMGEKDDASCLCLYVRSRSRAV